MCMADRQGRWQTGIDSSLGPTILGEKTNEHAILIRKEDPRHDEKIETRV